MIDINNIDDIELALDQFYTILNSVNDKHCKLKPTRSTPIINKWWTSELNDLSDKTKAAFDRYKRRRTDECREEYNALATEFKYAVKKAREKSFQSFVSETSNLSGMATLSRILRKPKGQEIGLLQDSEGRLTDSPEATCKVLLDHAFKESTPTTNRQMDTILQNVREHVQGFEVEELEWMSVERIREEIDSFALGKAPGPDLVSNKHDAKFPGYRPRTAKGHF